MHLYTYTLSRLCGWDPCWRDRLFDRYNRPHLVAQREILRDYSRPVCSGCPGSRWYWRPSTHLLRVATTKCNFLFIIAVRGRQTSSPNNARGVHVPIFGDGIITTMDAISDHRISIEKCRGRVGNNVHQAKPIYLPAFSMWQGSDRDSPVTAR